MNPMGEVLEVETALRSSFLSSDPLYARQAPGPIPDLGISATLPAALFRSSAALGL